MKTNVFNKHYGLTDDIRIAALHCQAIKGTKVACAVFNVHRSTLHRWRKAMTEEKA